MIDPDPNPADNLTGWKAKVVKRFILANPTATIREVSKATRASERTVSNVRAVLLRAGLIEPAALGRPPSPTETDAEDEIRRDIDAAIASGSAKILTRDERRQRLSAYADHPKVPHAAKIAALRELEATEPAEADQKLGPGVPLTRADRVHRVGLMIEAIVDIDGMQAANEAYEKGTGRTVPVDVGIIHVPMHVSSGAINASPVQRQDAPDVPLPAVREPG